MKVINELHLDTARVVVVRQSTKSLSELSSYRKGIEESGLNFKDILYVDLEATTKAELREAYQELLELCRSQGIHTVIDDSKGMSGKTFIRGYIFTSLFGKDTSLWKDLGVLYRDGIKFICSPRFLSAKRESESSELVDNEFIVKDMEYVVPETPEEAKKAFKELAKSDMIFFDTEGSGVRPFAKDYLLYTLQFTGSNDKNKSYIFFYEHPKKPVDDEFRNVVAKGSKWLLENRKSVIHNSSYDLLVCNRKFGLDPYKTDNYDTMIIYHFLTNTYTRVPLGLKDIAFKQGIFWDWDSDLDTFKKEYCQKNKIAQDDFKYEYFDLDTLIEYGAYDTVVLAYLWDRMEQMSKEHIALDVIRETWENTWQSIMQSLYKTMINGLPFDMVSAKKYQAEFEAEIASIDEKILNNNYIKKAEEKLSQANMVKAMAKYNKKLNEAKKKGKEFKGAAPSKEKGKYDSIVLDVKFNSSSTDHKKVLFIDTLKLPILAKTDTGNPKLDDDTIVKYAEQRPDIDILGLFSEKAKLIKQLTTYINPWIDIVENSIDGRLRSTFNPLNTSGRLKGSAPNLLNIPRDGILKKLIKAPEDSLILQIDVSGLEANAALMMHQDPVQMKMKEANVSDFHSVSAITISKAKKDGKLEHLDATEPEHLKIVKKEFPDLRQSGKQLTFGISFLCSWRSVKFTYNISEDIAKGILDKHWDTFHGEWAFIKDRVKDFSDNGYYIYHGNVPILTPNMTEDMEDKDNMSNIRTCYNGVHQSSAYAVLRALDMGMRRFEKEDIDCKIFLSVYDSIILECKIEDTIYISEVLEEYMSIPFIDNQPFLLEHDSEVGRTYKAEVLLEGTKEEREEILKKWIEESSLSKD